ncbi:MAG: hypothetical protein WBV55_23905, partial [Candidatus Sulfotelmatobacter sp.]
NSPAFLTPGRFGKAEAHPVGMAEFVAMEIVRKRSSGNREGRFQPSQGDGGCFLGIVPRR